MVPLGVMRPTLFTLCSTNHKLPSGPAVMATGIEFGVGMANRVRAPVVVNRPILLPVQNQRLPSGPLLKSQPPAGSWPSGKVVSTPPVVILTARDSLGLVGECEENQMLPSGPTVMEPTPIVDEVFAGKVCK